MTGHPILVEPGSAMAATKAHIQWIARECRESGHWVGECGALSIALEADSLEELRSVFDEALDLLFRDLLEEGKLVEFLVSRGWELAEGSAPAKITSEMLVSHGEGSYDLERLAS